MPDPATTRRRRSVRPRALNEPASLVFILLYVQRGIEWRERRMTMIRHRFDPAGARPSCPDNAAINKNATESLLPRAH